MMKTLKWLTPEGPVPDQNVKFPGGIGLVIGI